MSENTNPTNVFSVTGQVLGVYPSKKNNLPSGYLLLFRTGFYFNGKMQTSETSVFVNTVAQLPEVNDVVKVSGLLNVYNKQRNDGSYSKEVSVTETEREFLGQGQPRPRRTNQNKGKSFVNNSSGTPQKKEVEYKVSVDTSEAAKLPF